MVCKHIRYKLFFLFFCISGFLQSQEKKATGETNSAIDSLLQLVKTMEDDTAKIKILLELSGYYGTDNYIQALQHSLTAVEIATKVGNKKFISVSTRKVGNVYLRQSIYEKAIAYYLMALKAAEEAGDEVNLAHSLNNLGNAYANMATLSNTKLNYEESLKFHQRALTIRKKNDRESINNSLLNISKAYKGLSQHQKAIDCLHQALIGYTQQADSNGIDLAQVSLGEMYLELAKKNESMDSYVKAEEYFSKILYKGAKSSQLTNALVSMGEIRFRQNHVNEAINYLTEAVEIAKRKKTDDVMKSAALLLSEALTAKGDYKHALEYHKMYTDLKDTFLSEQSNKQITEMRTKYETDKKEKAIELLTKERKLKETELSLRNSVIVGIVLISLLVFVVYNRYSVKQRLTLDKQKLEIEKELIEIEQKLLRLQMNPHFIFNALTVVQGFINTDKKNEAGIYLSKISRLIRAVLENSREEYIPFEKELHNLENYLNINQLLLNNQFKYKIEVDDTIDREQTLIPPMLAQPFIENALKHGIQYKENGLIVIRFKKNNQTVVFEVEDNGMGITKSRITDIQNHQSLATTITKERLANLLRISVEKIMIDVCEVKSLAGTVTGTKTIFEIPVKYN